LQLPARFIKLLQTTCQLNGILPSQEPKELTALDLLGILVLGEARGFPEMDIAMSVPPAWRDSELEPVLLHDQRVCFDAQGAVIATKKG